MVSFVARYFWSSIEYVCTTANRNVLKVCCMVEGAGRLGEGPLEGSNVKMMMPSCVSVWLQPGLLSQREQQKKLQFVGHDVVKGR